MLIPETPSSKRIKMLLSLEMLPDYFGVDKEIKQINNFLKGIKDNPGEDNHFLLLSGPSGVGKTALINELVALNDFSLVEFERGSKVDKWHGQQENRIIEFFKTAIESKKWTCLLMDDIDGICAEPPASSESGYYYDRFVSTIQTQIDKLKDSKVVLIGATNNISKIKTAIKSKAGIPVMFTLPNILTRKKIIMHGLRFSKLENGIIDYMLEEIVFATSGWSPKLLKDYVLKLQTAIKQSGQTSITKKDCLEQFEPIKNMLKDEKRALGINLTPPTLRLDKNRDFSDSVIALDPEVRKHLEFIRVFLKGRAGYALKNFNLLLEGPPGTGKTLFAQTIADYCNATFIYIDASIYANSGVSGLKKCFETAKNNERSVIFIDELDGIAYKGSAATFLLQTELDGYVSEKSSNLLVVIAATNYPNKIADAALNRFTEEVVPLPDQKQRSELFSFYIRQIKQKCDKTLSELDTVSQELAKITSLFAPRDIKNLIDRALRYYMVKQDKDETILFSLTDILDACKAQKRQVMDRMAVNTYPPSYYGNQKSEVEEHSLSLSSGRFIDQVPKPILHNFSAGKMTASTEQALTNKASVQVESAGMQMNKN